MSKHTIYPYRPLQTLAPNLWRVVGSLPIPLLERNMFVYRLPNGRLVLDSVVAMEEDDMRELEKIGTPDVMVIPHPKHTMDAEFYKERYPQLRVYGSADAQEKLPNLPFDGTPTEGLAELGITVHVARGLKITENVIDLPLDGGRGLLFADVANQTEPDANILAKLFGAPGGGGVARALKLTQVDDTEKLREFLEELSNLPGVRLIAGCHGSVVTEQCNAWLANAAAQL